VASIRVMIVDDQELFASGIDIILKGYGVDDVTVVDISANGSEAVRKVARTQPDVILMDVRMPVMDGVEATRIIHERHPDIKILILTTFDDDSYVYNALNNGAIGYVLKNVNPEELVSAIKAVHAGNLTVSSAIGYRLVRSAAAGVRMDAQRNAEYQGDLNYLQRHFETLRGREVEVLNLIMMDYDNRQIAETLYLAEQTVRNYISVIYAKLGVGDRAHVKQMVKELLRKERGTPS
jgi:DNA-binding NarL/FixJ family response regulator